MKTTIETFEVALRGVLEENLGNKKLQKEINNRLSDRISIQHIGLILFGNFVIQDAVIAEVYLITKELFNITNDNRINPDKFFSKEEREDYDEYKQKPKQKLNKITIYDVSILEDGRQWMGVISYKDLYKYKDEITYNISTQRNPTYKKFGEAMVATPTIKQEAVKEIIEEIENDRFTSNTLTFNIRKIEGLEQKYNYDIEKRTLTIWIDSETTFVDILDGQHRKSGIVRVVHANPEIDKKMIINILHYNEEEALYFIRQEQHHTKMPKEYVASLNKIDPYMEFTKTLDTAGSDTTNALYKKFAKENKELRKDNHKLATFFVISKAVEYNFNWSEDDVSKVRTEIPKLRNFLIEFFNQFVSIVVERYGSIEKAKKDSLILQNTIFVGYFAIAKKLYETENWQENLKTIINRIDFSTHNDCFNKKSENYIGVFNDSPNRPTIKKIVEYFERMCF